jgi:hypothetical protein
MSHQTEETTLNIEPTNTNEEKETKVNNSTKLNLLKLNLEQVNTTSDKLEINGSQSARPRIKSPRSFFNLVSPRKKDVTTSPREEVTKFMSKRKDLNYLVKDTNTKIPIDETEDAMLIEMENQVFFFFLIPKDVLISPRQGSQNTAPKARKSMEVSPKHFQLLNSQ